MFLCSASGARLSVLWDGHALRQKFASLKHPQQKVFRVEVSDLEINSVGDSWMRLRIVRNELRRWE